MTKQINVTVDLDIARKMLTIAGFDIREKSDEEIFNLALHTCAKYGVNANVQSEDKIHTTSNIPVGISYSCTNEFLLRRLDEIDGELQDWHISAHKSDLLYKEKDAIVEELTNRGHFSKQCL